MVSTKAKTNNGVSRSQDKQCDHRQENTYCYCASGQSSPFPRILAIVISEVKDCSIVPHQRDYETKQKTARKTQV